jgi:tRNA threonylcarbamoyladenosine biosynthesis protein TsaE
VHLDLYRLLDANELEHLGLPDYFLPGHLWLIEWPEKGVGYLPPADLGFVFSIGEEGHRIQRVESVATKK